MKLVAETRLQIVERQMGAWRWGYPRGHRLGVSKYEIRRDAKGRLRYYSVGQLCDGISGGMWAYWYDQTGGKYGSIHRMLVVDVLKNDRKRRKAK